MLVTHNTSLSEEAKTKEDEKELEFAFICVNNQVPSWEPGLEPFCGQLWLVVLDCLLAQRKEDCLPEQLLQI